MKKSQLRNIIRESIKQVMSEKQGCSPNAIACQSMLGQSPPQSWITQMEQLAVSPGGCTKIVMRELKISEKFYSKIGTTSVPNCGPTGTIHRFCNGKNPKWAAQLSNKLSWLSNFSNPSPFMLCTDGTCNDHAPCPDENN